MTKMQVWSMFIWGFTGANLLNSFISNLDQGLTFLQAVKLVGTIASFVAAYRLSSQIQQPEKSLNNP